MKLINKKIGDITVYDILKSIKRAGEHGSFEYALKKMRDETEYYMGVLEDENNGK